MKKNRKKVKRKQKSTKGGRRNLFVRFFLKAALWFVALSLFFVTVFRWVPVPVTPLMLIRCYQQVTSGADLHLEHKWVPLERISKQLQRAVISSEDQKFPDHFGFDIGAIRQSIEDAKKHKRLRGASTISQQTAKNIFLWPGRSWIRKGLEIWFTVLIELIWDKERILEVYLNSIEMGPGVYGAETASDHWFHVKAENLTRYQSAALAAILPNPLEYNPVKSSPYIRSRIQWIMGQMGRLPDLTR